MFSCLVLHLDSHALSIYESIDRLNLTLDISGFCCGRNFFLLALNGLFMPRGFRSVHFCASRLTFGSAFSKLSSSTFDGKLVVAVVSVVALCFAPGEKKGELDIH